MGRRKGLKQSVLDDDTLSELNAVRIILSEAITDESTMAKDLPPLTKRLREATAEYQTLKTQLEEEGHRVPEPTPVDVTPHPSNVVEGRFDADAI